MEATMIGCCGFFTKRDVNLRPSLLLRRRRDDEELDDAAGESDLQSSSVLIAADADMSPDADTVADMTGALRLRDDVSTCFAGSGPLSVSGPAGGKFDDGLRNRGSTRKRSLFGEHAVRSSPVFAHASAAQAGVARRARKELLFALWSGARPRRRVAQT